MGQARRFAPDQRNQLPDQETTVPERTSIEWTDATWNPTTGCTRVSAGCDHCYADRLSRRLLAETSRARLPVVNTVAR